MRLTNLRWSRHPGSGFWQLLGDFGAEAARITSLGEGIAFMVWLPDVLPPVQRAGLGWHLSKPYSGPQAVEECKRGALHFMQRIAAGERPWEAERGGRQAVLGESALPGPLNSEESPTNTMSPTRLRALEPPPGGGCTASSQSAKRNE